MKAFLLATGEFVVGLALVLATVAVWPIAVLVAHTGSTVRAVRAEGRKAIAEFVAGWRIGRERRLARKWGWR